jgi:hypothetical protein
MAHPVTVFEQKLDGFGYFEFSSPRGWSFSIILKIISLKKCMPVRA